MAITSSAVRQLSDGNLVGTQFGQSATDLIGFYNVSTCLSRQGVGGISLSSGAGFSTVAQVLHNLGLINVSTAWTT